MRTSTSQVRPVKFQLTRKGRLLAAGVLLVLVSGLIVLAWVQLVMPPAIASDHQIENYQEIVVQPGDTLWDIASRVSQGAERAKVLDEILVYNDLNSSDLEIGQTLYVPVAHD